MAFLAAIGVGILLSYENEVTYQKPKAITQVATSTEETKEAWMEDEDAVQAAKEVIRKKELKRQEAQLVEEITKKQEELNEVRKELGTYWRNPENVKRLIRDTFPKESRKAIAIAFCESGLNPNAYNPDNRNGTTDGGLFQINSVHDERLEELGLDKYDPEDAATFARMLYEERGNKFTDWVCYNKRMHLAHM